MKIKILLIAVFVINISYLAHIVAHSSENDSGEWPAGRSHEAGWHRHHGWRYFPHHSNDWSGENDGDVDNDEHHNCGFGNHHHHQHRHPHPHPHFNHRQADNHADRGQDDKSNNAEDAVNSNENTATPIPAVVEVTTMTAAPNLDIDLRNSFTV